MSDYSKIAHITELILVFVLNALPGIVVLTTSKYQIDRFPPDVCYPSVDTFFHTFILPIAIYSTIGPAMLFTVFIILRRVSVMLPISRIHRIHSNVASKYVASYMHVCSLYYLHRTIN